MSIVNLTFGEAIENLKGGKAVRRQGWKRDGLFIFLIPEAVVTSRMPTPEIQQLIDDSIEQKSLIGGAGIAQFVPAQRALLSWRAATQDMLSEDWEVVHPIEVESRPLDTVDGLSLESRSGPDAV